MNIMKNNFSFKLIKITVVRVHPFNYCKTVFKYFFLFEKTGENTIFMVYVDKILQFLSYRST